MSKNKLFINYYSLENSITDSAVKLFDNYNADGTAQKQNFKHGYLTTGLPITETMDDGLNVAALVFKESQGEDSPPPLFMPYDILEIIKNKDGENDQEKSYWCVANDFRKTDNQNLKLYNKSVQIVEATKYLDTIFIYNCNITKTNINLYEAVKILLNNAEVLVSHNSVETVRFFINEDTATATILKSYDSEDFYFDNVTLREALWQMFDIANIRPFVKSIGFEQKKTNNISIFIESLPKNNITEITKIEDYGDIISDESEVSITNFFGTLKARGFNSLPRQSINTGVKPFISKTAVIDNTQVVADLGFSVESIKTFKVGTIDVEKFKVLIGGSFGGRDFELSLDMSGFFYDITNYLIDAEAYQYLPEKSDESKKPLNSPNKAYWLPYTRGEKEIFVLKSAQELFKTTEVLKTYFDYDFSKCKDSEIYKYILTNKKDEFINAITAATGYDDINLENVLITDITFLGSTVYNDFRKFSFISEFYPRFDSVIEITKPTSYSKRQRTMAIANNQNSTSIDINRFSQSLASLARRTGEPEIRFDMRCKSFSELLPVLGRFSSLTGYNAYLNGYVITKREYSVYDDFLKVRYTCTKDYQSICEKIGVTREKRLFKIPLQSSDCPIVVKYFVNCSKNKPSTNNAEVFNDELIKFLTCRLLISDRAADNAKEPSVLDYTDFEDYYKDLKRYKMYVPRKSTTTPTVLTMRTNETAAAQDKFNVSFNNDNSYILPTCVYAADKSVVIMAKPEDNYSVGGMSSQSSISWWGTKANTFYSPYVDSNGESDGFNIRLLPSGYNSTNINDFIKCPTVEIDNFPIVKDAKRVANNYIKINYKKDRTQCPVFYLMFEFMPSKSLFDEVVFGSDIASQNFLMQNSETIGNRYIVFSDSYYQSGDKKLKYNTSSSVKSPITNEIVMTAEDFDEDNPPPDDSYVCGYTKLTFTEDFVNLAAYKTMDKYHYKSIAIVDDKDNLILAFNNIPSAETNYYFYISRDLET